MKFKRGLDPKVAMNIGEIYFCKKKYVDELCSKCQHSVFNWNPSSRVDDPSNKNYCKLNHWGMPDKNFMKFLTDSVKFLTDSVKIQ